MSKRHKRRWKLTVTAVGTRDVGGTLLSRDGGSRSREGHGSNSEELGEHGAKEWVVRGGLLGGEVSKSDD